MPFPTIFSPCPVGAVSNRTPSAQLETLLVPTGRDSALRNPIYRGCAYQTGDLSRYESRPTHAQQIDNYPDGLEQKER